MTFNPQPVFSDVRSVSEPPAKKPVDIKKNAQDLARLYKEIPDLNDKEALKKYLEKRLKVVKNANMTPEEVASPETVSLIDVNALNKKQEGTISAYEKIYNETLKKAADMNVPLNADVNEDGEFYELMQPAVNNEPFVPDFPYVTIKLSDKREIMAPAEEHIAYLLTTIKIEKNAMMNVTEEFVFVSNNEGFPQGFFRILPKYTYSRSGSKRRLDLSLQSVTINDEEYPYKITEIGNHLYIEPEKPLNLPTGVYTYRFNYVIDRAVWFYDNFDEFNWDITGKTVRNVIGSTNALIILPQDNEFLAQNAIASTRNGLKPERVTITNLSPNSLGFADTEALAVGEDIHLFITLNKGTLEAPDMLKKYLWLIQDFGAAIFALLSLLAIWLSYKISLKQIRQNQDKTKAFIRKSPAIFRLINSNTFDKRSFLAELLDLCVKNIAELKTDEKTPVLVKKTDNLKKLPKALQKFVKILFPQAETALPANSLSELKISRAYNYLRRTIYNEYRLYILKLNKFYLLFSVAMVLCGIIATATISVNPTHTFWVITICSILIAAYILLFTFPFKKRWLNVVIKILSALSILYIAGWLAIYTSKLYAGLIILSIAMIKYYYQLFSRRNGLLRNKIKETEEYKSYLQKNPELAQNERDFRARLPYIYAFELENKYKDIESLTLIEKYNTLLKTTEKKE